MDIPRAGHLSGEPRGGRGTDRRPKPEGLDSTTIDSQKTTTYRPKKNEERNRQPPMQKWSKIKERVQRGKRKEKKRENKSDSDRQNRIKTN